MKRPTKTAFILTMGIFIILIIAGCEEGNPSAIRKSRLVVLENEKIKEELEGCRKENQEQKGLLEKEFEKKREDLEKKIDGCLKKNQEQKEQFEKQKGNLEKQLEDCRDQKRVLEGTKAKDIEKRVDSVLKDVVDENARLRQENEELKAELERLKAEKDK